MENIVLIGMPGCGKSTIGKILAKKLGMVFLDTDSYIEEIMKHTISEIFKCGECAFRDIEAKAVIELSKQSPVVISTGGGIIKRYENILNLKKNGTIIYINRPIKDIERDITVETRPLLSGGASEIYRLFEERKDIYKEYCHYEIMNITNIEDIVNNIIEIYAKIYK